MPGHGESCPSQQEAVAQVRCAQKFDPDALYQVFLRHRFIGRGRRGTLFGAPVGARPRAPPALVHAPVLAAGVLAVDDADGQLQDEGVGVGESLVVITTSPGVRCSLRLRVVDPAPSVSRPLAHLIRRDSSPGRRCSPDAAGRGGAAKGTRGTRGPRISAPARGIVRDAMPADDDAAAASSDRKTPAR